MSITKDRQQRMKSPGRQVNEQPKQSASFESIVVNLLQQILSELKNEKS